jgi:serine/threonine protein kinase
MAKVVKLQTLNGENIEFIDDIIGSGAMKDVYFSPDKSYVVAFYRNPPDYQAKERLLMLTGKYKESVFNQIGGNYWGNLFCWPTSVVMHNGKLGIVAPTYQKHFFFEHGSKNNDFLGIKGKEKEGKWFASANNQNRFLDDRERGNWLSYIKISLLIARAVRRMHAAGLAHSDLSYKNVLVDPAGGHACIIDVDGLVVPGRYFPDVVGTPDFIAPEVVATTHLDKNSPNRKLPSIATDKHALSVLIYMYLFYRHPLRGRKVHDINDEIKDESLTMGEKALFIEHPTDASNRINISQVKASELPWADSLKLPYKLSGPYLAPLFERAFIDGLKDPHKRPSAGEWEDALVKTVDLIQPCQNKNCTQKWYVFDNTTKPICPFCNTPYSGKLPILNLYSSRNQGNFRPDNHRLMVWTGQSLFLWHINKNIAPNERLEDIQKQRVGYFILHNNIWWIVNEKMNDFYSIENGVHTLIKIGDKVKLEDAAQLLFSKNDGGRLAVVQMAN